ncbi:rRNA maturation RNase YbeY [Candidatus Curtissbacteria bacterium]|nr:rRNA maturation RNase YbeY [Candidatus Curtissbacteria bacterium]
MLSVLIKVESRYPVNRKAIRQAVADVFQKEKIGNLSAEVSVIVCGARKMKELSTKYLGDDIDHEVLSFPLEDVTSNKGAFMGAPDDILRLGDVVVAWPEVVRLAGEKNVMIDEEMGFLVAHGVEHLLGKHHEE